MDKKDLTTLLSVVLAGTVVNMAAVGDYRSNSCGVPPQHRGTTAAEAFEGNALPADKAFPAVPPLEKGNHLAERLSNGIDEVML